MNGTSVWKYPLHFAYYFPYRMKHVFLSKIVNHIHFPADHVSVLTIIRSDSCLMIIWLQSFLNRLHHPDERRLRAVWTTDNEDDDGDGQGRRAASTAKSGGESGGALHHTHNQFIWREQWTKSSVVSVVVVMGAASFSLSFLFSMRLGCGLLYAAYPQTN